VASKCEKCGAKTRSKKNRYCPRCELKVLRGLEKAGFLEPLERMTIDGPLVLGNARFLSREGHNSPAS
jgi:hypothetical protein